MKISIVIPVYNVGYYVRECIESVIKQSYRDIEIIIVNDGSTDNSLEICKEYELKYPFVILIDKENGGLSDARNVGINNATGNYIIFLDSDDYWCDKNLLFDLVECIKKSPKIDYLFFKYKFFFQQKNIFKESTFNIEENQFIGKSGLECLDYILENMKKFQWFACMGMIRKDFLFKHNLFFTKNRNYEDMLWTPKVFIMASCIRFYNKAPYVYRLDREGQITSRFSYKNIDDSIFIAKYWYDYLKNAEIKSDLKRKIFTNINTRYFYAIKFSGFLVKNERISIIHSLQRNRNLLKYSNGKNLVIKMLCKILGFTFTIKLLYFAIKARTIL